MLNLAVELVQIVMKLRCGQGGRQTLGIKTAELIDLDVL